MLIPDYAALHPGYGCHILALIFGLAVPATSGSGCDLCSYSSFITASTHWGSDTMHVIALIALIALIVVIVVNLGSRRVGNAGRAPSTPAPPHAAFKKPCEHTLAFISGGKLFYQAPGQELRELQSPHVQAAMERTERSRQLHGWKQGTAFAWSITGPDRPDAAGGVRIQAPSAQFAAHDRVLYFLKDDSFGGLFEYDLTQGIERRLLHNQKLPLAAPRLHPDGRQLLCAQHAKNGTANIVMMDADGGNYREVPGGDTVDAAPAWIPGEPNLVLFQSSGLARNPDGYVIAHGPTSIPMAATAARSPPQMSAHPPPD